MVGVFSSLVAAAATFVWGAYKTVMVSIHKDVDELKDKLRAVIIFVMAVTFLEHLVLWQDPVSTLTFGAAIAIMIVALVVSARFGRRNDDSQNQRG